MRTMKIATNSAATDIKQYFDHTTFITIGKRSKNFETWIFLTNLLKVRYNSKMREMWNFLEGEITEDEYIESNVITTVRYMLVKL